MIQGKGFYVWKLYDSLMVSPSEFARACMERGFSHVLIKISDGTSPFNVYNGVDLARLFVDACHARGVQVIGWQYVYHYQPKAEAAMAARRVAETGVDGFVIDAEAQAKTNAAAALEYTRDLRSLLSGVEIGLSSYRWPSLHRELAWRAYLDRVDYVMPQVYWVGASNPGAQLQRSLDEYRKLAPGKPFIPTGAAYHENGWTAAPEDIREFYDAVQALGLPGCNFWEWCNALRYGLWETVASLGGSVPEPKPEPTRIRVVTQRINIRGGPGLSNLVKGQLWQGSEAEIMEIIRQGSETWARVSIDGWVAAEYNSQTLAEVE